MLLFFSQKVQISLNALADFTRSKKYKISYNLETVMKIKNELSFVLKLNLTFPLTCQRNYIGRLYSLFPYPIEAGNLDTNYAVSSL